MLKVVVLMVMAPKRQIWSFFSKNAKSFFYEALIKGKMKRPLILWLIHKLLDDFIQ
jgi:hypothetical protein